MEIKYFGHSSFQIKTKQAVVITDPYQTKNQQLGLKFPSGLTADIVTVSHDHFDHNAVAQIEGNPYLIKEPGEFEIKEVNIFGVGSYHDEVKGSLKGDNNIFVLEAEGFSVCHLGDLGHVLENDQTSDLDNIDILFIPVGGNFTIDAKKAVEVMEQIEPKIVIPMHYKLPGSTLEISPVEDFLKESGFENAERLDKLVVKNREDLGEEMKVVVLQVKS